MKAAPQRCDIIPMSGPLVPYVRIDPHLFRNRIPQPDGTTRMLNFKEKPHLLWFGAAVLILVAESVLFFAIWTSFGEREQWSIHTHQVLEKIEYFLSEMKDAETGQRGYLLTGKDQYLEPYNSALQSVPAALDDLRHLAADNPRQQARIENLRPLVDGKLAELKKTIELRQARGSGPAIEEVLTGRGQQIMDRVRVVTQAMKDDELSLLAQRKERRLATARALIFTMAFGSGLLLIVLLAGTRAIDRHTAARARAEAAEKTQREWLQVTLASIGDGVIATDTEGHVTLINPVAAQLTGWAPQDAQAQPLETVFEIRNEETGNKVENPALRAIREGRIVGLANHTILIAKDGKRTPLDDSGAPIVDASGGVLGAVLIFRDITGRKQAETEIAQQARMLGQAYEPMFAWDLSGTINYWNNAAQALYGFSREEAVGRRSHELLRTENPIGMERLDAILAGAGFWTGELFHTSKDGRRIQIETIMTVVADPDGRRVVLETGRDITERKQAEDALAASESKLRALLDTASQGVVAVDESGSMVLVNAKIEEMFGYTRDELLGQPLGILLPERFRMPHGEQVRHYFARPYTRVMGLGIDLWGRTKNGDEFPMEASLSCVEQGGSRLAMALVTDITERKQAEERFLQAQRMESVGQLAAGVAHDFNNLLTGVIGSSSLALELVPPGDPVAELMEQVIKTGEQLAYLTRQMLAYSGKGRFVVESLNLSDLIQGLLPLVKTAIPKQIELRAELEPGLPPIEADKGQIQQIFTNLIINAAEAIGSAGVITAKTGLQAIGDQKVADLAPGKYVRLEVRDTGSGMDDATKAKIFEPFFSTKFVGRGLGLAAVSGIVRGHKGAIMVESAPGKGTAFTILLPATEPVVPAPRVLARDANLIGSGTILVVDDEEIVRSVAKTALERYGYTVLLAENGLAAINVCKRHPGGIELVLLDLSMPIMGGEEALPQLRKIRPNVKIIATSGYSEAEMIRLFAGQQVSGFLQKPFTSARLAEDVKKALEA
jgi:PAS domain S-box-containing protein